MKLRRIPLQIMNLWFASYKCLRVREPTSHAVPLQEVENEEANVAVQRRIEFGETIVLSQLKTFPLALAIATSLLIHRIYITVFTIPRHSSLSWGGWTQSTFSHLIYRTYFNIILLCKPRSYKEPVSYRALHQNSACIYVLRHTWLMSRLSHFPWYFSRIHTKVTFLSSSKNSHVSSDSEVPVGILNCQLFDLYKCLLTGLLCVTRQCIYKRHVTIASMVGKRCLAIGLQALMPLLKMNPSPRIKFSAGTWVFL